ncbi:MAG: hypothetical protein R3B13_28720 [Polyangiaceae bacterium]
MKRGLWCVVLLAACDHGAPSSQSTQPALAPAAAAPAGPAPVAEPVAPSCRERIAAVRRSGQAFAAGPERAEVLARAKAEPVVFVKRPQQATDVGGEVESYRRQLAQSPAPGYTLTLLYKFLRNRPEVARALLLREGYLYSEVPSLAAAMVDLVEPQHLYDAPDLVIERGSAHLRAQRKGNHYEYLDGPETGARARVLLYDRVWPAGEDPGPPLVVDVRTAKHELGFSRLELQAATAKELVARARYGRDWVPTLFRINGASLDRACEDVPADAAERVAQAREFEKRRAAVLAKKQGAILAMVREALPFDEPRTEEGQQDGNLRPAWRWAYTHGWDMYRFNDDNYLVFDASGRPKVPQVCIDFVTDTLERASGTWWSGRDAKERGRSVGGIDFDSVGIENRRSVDVFIQFAKRTPEWFDVYELDPEERVRFLSRPEFFAHLAQHADRYQAGDVVAIFGPRSDGENHWHSFFIYDSDPVTGMPLVLASNAGRPRIRTWEAEMRSAPLRSIKARIRFRQDWLERALGSAAAPTPPPLISAPI